MRAISYASHHFPPETIRCAVWLSLRFTLSYRDVEELLAERGIQVTDKIVRRRVLTFGPLIDRTPAADTPPCPTWALASGRDVRPGRGQADENGAESPHVPMRRRELKQQGFESPRSAQPFVSLHSAVYNVFNV